jgi:Mn-dependent DtxR family transcriptional regulator
MKIQIDNQTIMLEVATEKQQPTQVQRETLESIIEISKTCNSISAKALANYLHLKSALPLWSRLEHLQKKGWVEIVEAATIAA